MLLLKDICKTYVTGELTQTALDHVSLGFRDNEFVAVLGPSGSGKTTMLNIIGGLDRYDSGDLIINRISTKKYKDRDWDSYRNHTIGFVFQSYNLIPHQTILANVELALTISGVSGSQRTKRAKEALEKVGLGDQIHKKPSQLSGGQMQRVAIARALVNNPDILLADEPTGALDTDTSVQVMNLLKEVASDRLVIMVTHNPELAEQYATRIVRLRDGRITSDTDPVDMIDEETEHRNLGKASMSFLTALHLSFNNLRSKLARTILVSAAGSIGIIGIALIMALSGGVNQYISDVEEETLSEYPLQILSTAMDLSSLAESAARDRAEDGEVRERQTLTRMLSGVTTNDLYSLKTWLDSGTSGIDKHVNAVEYAYNFSPQIYLLYKDKYRQVNPDQTFAAMGYDSSALSGSLMSSMVASTNLFNPLPEHRELYESQYDVKAGHWPENDHECVVVLSPSGRVTDMVLYAMGILDPDHLDEMVKKFSEEEKVEIKEKEHTYKYTDLIGKSFKLVNASQYYIYDSEYEIWINKTEDKDFMYDLVKKGEDLTVAGVVQAKESANAAMLTMGICFDPALIRRCVAAAEHSEIVAKQMSDKNLNVFTGKAFDDEDTSFDSSKLFSVNEDALGEVFKVDTSKMKMDFSGLDLKPEDFSDIDLSGLDLSGINMPEMDIASILSSLDIRIDYEQAGELLKQLAQNYSAYAQEDPDTDYTQLPQSMASYLQSEEGRNVLKEETEKIIQKSGLDAVDNEVLQKALTSFIGDFQVWMSEMEYTDTEQIAVYLQEYLEAEEGKAALEKSGKVISDAFADVSVAEEDIQAMSEALSTSYDAFAEENGMPQLQAIAASFKTFMETEETQKLISDNVRKVVNADEISEQISKTASGYMAEASSAISSSLSGVMRQVMGSVAQKISGALTSSMADFAEGMKDAFSFNPDALKDAFSMNFSESDLQDLMTSMARRGATYDSNIRTLGYADLSKPYSVSIFPKDFESKTKILDLLDGYNERMKNSGAEEKVITYTDLVGTLMSNVTTIVDTISYVLIAFVAISLIVSSIMIGVITYISVLERSKEIGILRAIGASKRNISEVFNAETFIIGLLSGIIGIGVTLLLLPVINFLIHTISGNYNVNAALPMINGAILIVISVILTLIGGLIPSRKAARRDPVEALRSE